jgi:hypothetical protein
MSLETLKPKVAELIEKAKSNINPTQYEFYKNYIEGKLSGDIVIPDWFVPYTDGSLFVQQPKVTSLDTGYISSLTSTLVVTAKIHSLPAVKRIYFRNLTNAGYRVMQFEGMATPNQTLKSLETIEFGKVLTTMNSGWVNVSGERSNVTTVIIPQGWNCSTYFHSFFNLTTECLHAMIENLADLTGITSKTFSIGSQNIAKIDEEHIAMLENKNWELS